MTKSINIGMTYKHDDTDPRRYVAVRETLLLTFSDGQPEEIPATPELIADLHRDQTIEFAELCRLWGLSTTELDEITAPYFCPDFEPESKQKAEQEQLELDLLWRDDDEEAVAA